MNRKRLMKALKAAGFTGKTYEEALAFIKAENLELKDGATVLDEAAIKAAWEVKASLVIEDEPEPEKVEPTKKAVDLSEKDDEDEDDPAKKSAEVALKNARKAAAAAVTKKDVPGVVDGKRAIAIKQYATKIKATAALPFGHKSKAVFETPEDAEFGGAFLRLAICNLKGGFHYTEKANDLAIIGKASTEANNTSAGVLVAPQYFPQVLWLTEQYGVARKLANVQRFSRTDEWRRPRKTAILGMQYIGEGATITATDNSYDLITLIPRKYGGLMVFSTELWEDSAVSIADQFVQSVAEGQALAEDQAYFLGDGSATYGNQTGLKNALPSGAYIAAGANYGVFTLAGLTNLPGNVQNTAPGSNTCYVSCRQAFYQVAARLFNAGGGNKGIDLKTFSPLNPGPNGADATFNGEPWYFAQAMFTSASGSTSGNPEIYYGDFAAASMIGIHTDLRIQTSTDVNFNSDQIAMRATSRFAVNIHGDGRGSTVGPIAALKIT